MRRLRIVADDLTGALDSTVGFAGAVGPVLICRSGPAPEAAACAAIDMGTRDLPATALGSVLSDSGYWFDAADLCFKKIDSLLRGHWAAELAAIAAAQRFDRIVVAPAFVQQGRLTIGGRLHFSDRQGPPRPPRPAPGASIADALAEAGLPGVAVRRADKPCEAFAGVAVFDVVDESDLFALAAAGLSWPGRTLWVGAAGLTQAQMPVDRELVPPLLMVIGSVHPRTAAQLTLLRAQFPAQFIDRHKGSDVQLLLRIASTPFAPGPITSTMIFR